MILKNPIKFNHIENIAQLHISYLNTGFLSQLGEKFLYYLYEAMSESDLCFIFAYCENDQVKAFVSGTEDLNRFYKFFLKKYFFKIFISLLPAIFSFNKLKKIIEIILYIKNNSPVLPELPKEELLSIVVHKDLRGKSIGKKLFISLVDEFKNRNVREFKIIVGKSLENAKKFYESLGVKKVGEFELHKNEVSIIYIYKIK